MHLNPVDPSSLMCRICPLVIRQEGMQWRHPLRRVRRGCGVLSMCRNVLRFEQALSQYSTNPAANPADWRCC